MNKIKNDTSAGSLFFNELSKTEKLLFEVGDKIHLIVISKWMKDELESYIEPLLMFKSEATEERNNDFEINGYKVEVIGDLDYKVPVRFISGMGL